ncbi:MAG TPA: hypothetical protein VJ997_06765 [Longimicrobiales bacterium]|nr:hypothetical protein [Longimicrobiales bacterium]
MLAADQLAELYRTHRNHLILSVYLDADQHDFAQRGKWRIAFKNHVGEQRRRAEEPGKFDRALEHLESVLTPDGNHFLPGKGWVGFATADELLYAEGLPVDMPDLVRWERGLRVAPYTRVLRRNQSVVAALIDSRHARVVRLDGDLLGEGVRIHADTYLGDLSDIKVRKRPSQTSGIRGQTGSDAAQTFLDVERDRLAAAVAERVRDEIGDDAIVVLGGNERAVAALRERLSDLPESRRSVASSLHMDVSDVELTRAMGEAAAEVSLSKQRELLGRILDDARADGKARLGPTDTIQALREKRVRTLAVSGTYRARHPDRADHLEGAALDQDADVVELHGEPAERLDAAGDGVAVLLRYRLRD